MGDSILDRVLAVLGSSLGSQAITIIFTPILVRLLGVGAYGEYAFILSVMSISTVVVSAGTFDSARKFIAEKNELEYWHEYVFGVYARVVFALSVVSAVLFIAAGQLGLIELLLNAAYVPYIYLLALLVPLQAAFRLSRSVLMGLNLESVSEPLYIFQRVLFVLLALTLVWFGWGVVGALIGRTLAYASILVFMLGVIYRRLDLSAVIQLTPPSFPRRTLLSYNSSTVVFKLLVTSLYNIDIMLLGIIVGSTATGSYRAALVIAQFLWLVPTAVQVGLLHSTSRYWSNDEYDRISAVSSRAVRLTLIFTLLLVLGVAALTEPLVSLYFGEEFSQTSETVLYLLPGVLGFAVARPIYATSQGHGNLRPVLLATAVASVLNIVLNLVLIPHYGAVGAAIATSIGYGSMVLLHIWGARTLRFHPTVDLRLPNIVTTVALAAIPIFGLPQLLEGNILQLIIVPPTGFAIYTVLAIRTRAVDPAEAQMMIESEPISALSKMLPPQVVLFARRSLRVVLGTRL